MNRITREFKSISIVLDYNVAKKYGIVPGCKLDQDKNGVVSSSMVYALLSVANRINLIYADHIGHTTEINSFTKIKNGIFIFLNADNLDIDTIGSIDAIRDALGIIPIGHVIIKRDDIHKVVDFKVEHEIVPIDKSKTCMFDIIDKFQNVCGNRAKMHKELNKRNIGDDVDMKNIGIMSFEDFINVIQRAGANEYEADKSKIEVSKLDELVITGGLVKAGYTGEITLDVIQDVKFNARGINLDEYDYKRHILLMNDMDTPENILSEINSDKNVHRIIIKKDGLTYTNIEVTYNNENIVAYDFINNTRNEIKK